MLTVEDWVQELEQGPSAVHLATIVQRFDTPLKQVKERINQLVRDGRVTGCIDEVTNTFWVFSHDNLLALATFIQKQGEVSLNDLSKTAGDILKK